MSGPLTADEALRDALAYALILAKVNGSPVHEHLGDLLSAVVPDTLMALPEGWRLTNEALEALRKETNPVPATYVHRSGNESGCGACADSLLEGDTLDPNHPAAPSGKGDADGEWCWCGHYIEAAAHSCPCPGFATGRED